MEKKGYEKNNISNQAISSSESIKFLTGNYKQIVAKCKIKGERGGGGEGQIFFLLFCSFVNRKYFFLMMSIRRNSII